MKVFPRFNYFSPFIFAAGLICLNACIDPNPEPDPVLPAWETHQANAAHTGYVPVVLDPARFAEKWVWVRPTLGEGVIDAINTPAAADGLVFISDDDYHSEVSLYALDEADGSIIWQYDFGAVAALNPPSVSNGLLYIATSGHEDSYVWVFDSETGILLGKSSFSSQWPNYLAPTIFENIAYFNTGYYGGRISAANAEGLILWESGAYGDNDMFTPAVDQNYVYQYSGYSLNLLDRANGQLVSTIDDLPPSTSGYGHYGSTIIGSNNNIYAFSGDNFSGRAGASVEPYNERPISSFDVENGTVAWQTENLYLTYPAVSQGLVFAASNSPLRLEAVSEETGEVVWYWVPQDAGVTTFRSNIVATDSHIFVSSNTGVHCIDRTSHEEVWHYDSPGRLAISPGGLLLITEGEKESTGRLIAVDLFN